VDTLLLAATVAASGKTEGIAMLGKRLDSGWGVLLPCALMPLMTMMELSFSEWRWLMVVALLATVVMLCHKRLRHYLLLPSCLALAGGVAAASLNFSTL